MQECPTRGSRDRGHAATVASKLVLALEDRLRLGGVDPRQAQRCNRAAHRHDHEPHHDGPATLTLRIGSLVFAVLAAIHATAAIDGARADCIGGYVALPEGARARARVDCSSRSCLKSLMRQPWGRSRASSTNLPASSSTKRAERCACVAGKYRLWARA